MQWVTALNASIDFIEANITNEIDADELARIAQCSSFHYQRMFAYLSGVTLSEYIRRRRMSLAAADLFSTDMTVLQIGLKYGYSSPTSFNRAFQSVHGMSPSAARQEGASLTTYSPMQFAVSIRGVEKMNYRIEHKDPIRIVGKHVQLSANMEENYTIYRKAWEDAVADGSCDRLVEMVNGEPNAILAATFIEGDAGTYWVAAPTDAPTPEGFDERTIPALTYAIFEGRNVHGTMAKMFQDIMVDWLPNSGFTYAGGPDLEIYLEPDPVQGKYEIWIPVTKE